MRSEDVGQPVRTATPRWAVMELWRSAYMVVQREAVQPEPAKAIPRLVAVGGDGR